ncbi:MAG TPA: MipA/OmpV family protein [Thermodesulfovibrionales bacterium]|nr:MipA/OmpV family protein [Thermodesulfovibrionales bacterium]
MRRFILGCSVALVSLFVAVAAHAAGMDSAIPVEDSIPNIVGVAVGGAPDYMGSNDYRFVAAPFLKYTFEGERYVQLLATELNVNLLNHPILRFGPSLNYRFGRKDSVEDEVVKQMTELKGAVEAGAFVGAVFREKDPRQRLVLNLDFLQDVTGHSKGYILTLSGRYWYPISRPIDLSLGVSTSYASRNWMEYYFGVNANNVGTSGLPFYDASSGLRDVSFSPTMVYHLSRSWHLAAGARYQYLTGPANNSPVVALRGSSSQWLFGVGGAYSW